ncbi:MAG: alpha/beta hydrolase, partial [Actinomycetota bacterium]
MTKELFTVPVSGGSLTVARWPGSGPVVLGLHGVTANHMLFGKIAGHLGGDVTLVVPDLRGRGGSSALGGPYGMAAHAADAAAVLDALDVDACVVAGISMGGFASATFAELYPDRVSSLVLIDGGVTLGIEPPTDGSVDLDAMIEQVLGPAVARLSMTFGSKDAYHDFWRAHPAFQPDGAWQPDVEEYVDYDLAPGVTPLRSRVSAEAVRGDSADTLVHPDVYSAFERVSCPITWIRAERGLFNQIPPLYPDERARAILSANPHMSDVFLPGVNHYT